MLDEATPTLLNVQRPEETVEEMVIETPPAPAAVATPTFAANDILDRLFGMSLVWNQTWRFYVNRHFLCNA